MRDARLIFAAAASLAIHALVFAGAAWTPLPSSDASVLPPLDPTDSAVKLGIADSDHITMTWLGYQNPTPHEAPRSRTEQPLLTLASPAPGPPPAEPSPPSSQPSESAPVAQAEPANESDPDERRRPDASEPPPAPFEPEPSPPEPDTPEADTPEADTPEADTPEADTPEAVATEPNPPEPFRLGPAGEVLAQPDAADPAALTPETPSPATAESRWISEVAEHLRPLLEALASAPSASPAASTQAAPPPPSAGDPPVPPGAGGPPDSQPGSDNSEASPTSTKDPVSWKPGQTAAAEGLEIETRVPARLSIPAELLSARVRPIFDISFARDGTVKSVVVARSSGNINVDEPWVSALYRWRAKGAALDALDPEDPEAVITVQIQILPP